MTIQELADAHVGHKEELGEDMVITAQRESFKWGALHVLEEFEELVDNVRFYSDLSASTRLYEQCKYLIEELKGGEK